MVLVAKPPVAPATPVTFDEILQREREYVKLRRKKVFPQYPTEGEKSPEVLAAEEDACLKTTLFGICFSGGGIRSATFNLGVLQGLAGHGMLQLADYLSTVSGGGYIGSWFHGVVKREPFKSLQDVHGNFYTDYQHYLANQTRHPGDSGHDPITFLRKYSNYLSPQLGLLSPDSWVIGTIWLRNTILNQLILFMAIVSALLTALFLGNALKLFELESLVPALSLLTVVALFLVVYRIDQNVGRVMKYELGLPRKGPAPDTDTTAWWRIVLPLWLVGMLVSLLLTNEEFRLQGLTYGGGMLAALLLLFGTSITHSGFWHCYEIGHAPKNPHWQRNRLLLTVAFVLSCSVVTFVLFSLEQKMLLYIQRAGAGPWHWGSIQPPSELGKWLCILIAPVCTILILAFGVALQQGLAGVDFADSAREWYSRLAAKLFILSTGWLVWLAIAAFAPLGVFWLWDKSHNYTLTTAVLAWLGSTAAGVFGGKSGATSGPTKDDPEQVKPKITVAELAAKYAPPIALLGILIALATFSWWALDTWLASNPELTLHPESATANPLWSLTGEGNLWLLLFVVILAVVAYLLSTRININEFSLNHFYKNRLVRCYLGASQGDLRRPNRFTGFDPKDDVLLSDLLPTDEKNYLGPFPIVNCALNLNHGKELAWQERKATNFVFTASHCGYVPRSDPQGFVTTPHFAQPNGPHIGTAIAISGAAVNPNFGYHTQPSTAFLMTIFNVRLGWWVGNTRFPDAAETPGPPVALRYLVSELLGFTDEDSRYANLSDGGHFENLGIYELARRKCKFIIVGDGEQDNTYQFESLGGAIRKIRVDFGYSIVISPKRVFLNDGFSQVHCALGTIDYHDGSDRGIILYLKSSLTGDESYDVLQHKKASPAFPHDSTLNQFFTESMFESYRALGKHVVEKVFHHIDKPASPCELKETFAQLQSNWLPPVTAVPGSFTKHTHVYSRLLERLAAADGLRFLDSEVLPHHPPIATDTVSDADRRRAEILIMDFVQLMEDVYQDLNLEDDSQLDHQENAGWVQLFGYWTKQPTFERVWRFACSTYSSGFQRFYTRMRFRPSAQPDD